MKPKQVPAVESRMRFMPCTVKPSDSVAHARALLDEHRVNHLPVLSKGRLVGIVCTRDLHPGRLPARRRAIERPLEMHPDRVAIASVMTAPVHTAKPKDTVTDAAKLMLRKHVGALPIIEQGRLRGILERSYILISFLRLVRRRDRGKCKVQRRVVRFGAAGSAVSPARTPRRRVR
jgi:acetoin utilization protein AcuB